MLSLLLDEQISHEVANQIRAKRPDIAIISLHFWEEGVYVGAKDDRLLPAVANAGLTLVTYDQNTIPTLLTRLADREIAHAGIVLVDEDSVPSNDVGGLLRALALLWDECREGDWTNRMMYLRPAP
jgi:hypothetical protein